MVVRASDELIRGFAEALPPEEIQNIIPDIPAWIRNDMPNTSVFILEREEFFSLPNSVRRFFRIVHQ
jgi:hypothetical protein